MKTSSSGLDIEDSLHKFNDSRPLPERLREAFRDGRIHSFPYTRRELTVQALIAQASVSALCVRADGKVWLISVSKSGAWRRVKSYGSIEC